MNNHISMFAVKLEIVTLTGQDKYLSIMNDQLLPLTGDCNVILRIS